MDILWCNLGPYLSLYLPALQYFFDKQRACKYRQIRFIATGDINVVFVGGIERGYNSRDKRRYEKNSRTRKL